MKKNYFLTFIFLFTSVLEANENQFSSEDLKSSNVEVYWQDSLHKILLKYLKGLDAYVAKDYQSAYNIWLPMAKNGFSGQKPSFRAQKNTS